MADRIISVKFEYLIPKIRAQSEVIGVFAAPGLK